MNAKRPTTPTRAFHSEQELRLEVDKLKRQTDALEAILDAKLARSMYSVRADVPIREK